MPPRASSTIETIVLADGSRAFHLRFRADGERQRVILHERDGCPCGCGGGWTESAARHELGDVVARVRAGVWKPKARVEAKAQAPAVVPTFHEYGSAWL